MKFFTSIFVAFHTKILYYVRRNSRAIIAKHTHTGLWWQEEEEMIHRES